MCRAVTVARAALVMAWAALCAASAVASPDAPALPYAAAVAARFAEPVTAYLTPGLQPGRDRWTGNDELAASLRTLAGAGAGELLDLGRTETGAELLALRFSRGAGRPLALVVGQQHGNEPAGGEALLALAMQLANPQHPASAVLDHLDVLLLPRANPDGAALDRRRNAAGVDINRDHLLLRTREAGAVADLVARWRPVLFVDVHEHIALGRYVAGFGGIKRHDLLIQYASTPNLPPAMTALSEQAFRLPLLTALDAAGITHEWYYTNAREPVARLLTMGGAQPGLARNAGGLKQMVSVLLESRGFDLGRLHAQRRVHSHVVALHSLLRSAAQQAQVLPARLAGIGEAVSRQACEGALVLDAAPTRRSRSLQMIGPGTGGDLSVTVDWDDMLQLRPVQMRTRPCGYWLAPDATEAVARLHRWGVTVHTLPVEQAMQGERYVETGRFENRPGEEGSTGLRITADLAPATWPAPAGSFYIPMNQPLANLVAAALEPDTAHGWFAHGLLPRLDAVMRVTTPRP